MKLSDQTMEVWGPKAGGWPLHAVFDEQGNPACGADTADLVKFKRPWTHAGMWCSACFEEVSAKRTQAE